MAIKAVVVLATLAVLVSGQSTYLLGNQGYASFSACFLVPTVDRDPDAVRLRVCCGRAKLNG